jgi:malate dehydrogenase (oxaloacetate-decarboxylating)(NADP+)
MTSSKLNITKEKVFEYHLGGKIGLLLTKELKNQTDLSLAYTPGVSFPCLEIQKNSQRAWDLTAKRNLVAVMTDGSAVLGLGNIGAKASIPVMEGKAVLLKAFANIDGWPVPLEHVSTPEGKTDVEKFLAVARSVAPMYGGINLEDIAAPACFEIERRLDEELDIPVFHDDQWGTAIIVLAAIKNYLLISNKKKENLAIVINGAGAAGIRIADMLKAFGIKNILLCDSKGVIHHKREDIESNPFKKGHAAITKDRTLKEAMKNRDVFIGVSVADCVTPEMVLSMNDFPAIFAMANPNPEIKPELVKECMGKKKYILATGRSDYPNQINNVLGFPYIFRGALDVQASKITQNMKLAASDALATLAREKEIPEIVKKAYNRDFEFGPDYLIPTPFDPRINLIESKAVALAAIKDGVSKIKTLPEKYS